MVHPSPIGGLVGPFSSELGSLLGLSIHVPLYSKEHVNFKNTNAWDLSGCSSTFGRLYCYSVVLQFINHLVLLFYIYFKSTISVAQSMSL